MNTNIWIPQNLNYLSFGKVSDGIVVAAKIVMAKFYTSTYNIFAVVLHVNIIWAVWIDDNIFACKRKVWNRAHFPNGRQ